jgi:hypothetical protein
MIWSAFVCKMKIGVCVDRFGISSMLLDMKVELYN